MRGISKSRVSELCEELDEEVERFRNRPLEGSYPYVWVDATYRQRPPGRQVASTAVVIAVGVKAKTGEREVLGLDVGPSEDGAFWRSFLRSLVARGLSGVRLVTSDAHRGSEERRCGCLGRSLLAEVPGALHEERPLFGAQSGPADGGGDHPHRLRPARRRGAHEQWRRVSEGFRHRFPRLSELMEEAEEDVLSYASFPRGALAEDLVQQPAGASEQGGQEEDERGGHIPERGGGDTAGGFGALRSSTTSGRSRNATSAWISGEAGAKGGADRAAAVDGGLGSVEPRRGDLHT